MKSVNNIEAVLETMPKEAKEQFEDRELSYSEIAKHIRDCLESSNKIDHAVRYLDYGYDSVVLSQ